MVFLPKLGVDLHACLCGDLFGRLRATAWSSWS